MQTDNPPSSSTEPIKFTIATVTYNAAEFIEKTILSVAAQDYPHVEHLIIDGNSTDKTLEHIHHYQERNSIAEIPHEIVCRTEPDDGLYDAMNKALRIASGHYILFLNAGDTLHSTTILSDLAKQIDPQNLPAVLYGHTDIVDSNGQFIAPRRLAPPEQLSSASFKQGMLVCHQAFLANMDLAKDLFYDCQYRFSADFDWCVRLMKHAECLGMTFLNSHMVICNYLNEGLTTKNHRRSLKERFVIMTHHYGWLSTVVRHIGFLFRQ
jgi:glycosyltransferase involved in cell wall biosynthesis